VASGSATGSQGSLAARPWAAGVLLGPAGRRGGRARASGAGAAAGGPPCSEAPRPGSVLSITQNVQFEHVGDIVRAREIHVTRMPARWGSRGPGLPEQKGGTIDFQRKGE
jgi:hypothetical protein